MFVKIRVLLIILDFENSIWKGFWTFWRKTFWQKVQFGEINLTKSIILLIFVAKSTIRPNISIQFQIFCQIVLLQIFFRQIALFINFFRLIVLFVDLFRQIVLFDKLSFIKIAGNLWKWPFFSKNWHSIEIFDNFWNCELWPPRKIDLPPLKLWMLCSYPLIFKLKNVCFIQKS